MEFQGIRLKETGLYLCVRICKWSHDRALAVPKMGRQLGGMWEQVRHEMRKSMATWLEAPRVSSRPLSSIAVQHGQNRCTCLCGCLSTLRSLKLVLQLGVLRLQRCCLLGNAPSSTVTDCLVTELFQMFPLGCLQTSPFSLRFIICEQTPAPLASALLCDFCHETPRRLSKGHKQPGDCWMGLGSLTEACKSHREGCFCKSFLGGL